jgi:hypothetical protein
MKTDTHFWSYLAHFFVEWEMLQTKVVEKIKTHTFINFFFENRAVYAIILKKNMLEPDGPQMTI